MDNHSLDFTEIEQVFLDHNDAKILSLDCFDTLFWRYVSEPSEIFSAIDGDIQPYTRIKSEASARARKEIRAGNNEVSLLEIYLEALADDEKIAENLVLQEMYTEVKYGFINPYALKLLKSAKARGMRNIIVSDIYYSAEQLFTILGRVCPELLSLIDEIYCSSDYSCAKSTGLWNKVVDEEKISPEFIIHVGDNEVADYISPKRIGINAFHFLKENERYSDFNAQRKVAAGILFPEYKNTSPMPALFDFWYSQYSKKDVKIDEFIGNTCLGPILYLFSKFIHEKIQFINKPKIAFLMRDGYMPMMAWKKIFPNIDVFSLRISRLTSICSSFVDKKSIEDYIADVFRDIILEGKTLHDSMGVVNLTLKHFMLDLQTKNKIVEKISANGYSLRLFSDLVLSDDIVTSIVSKSEDFRHRLIKHINHEVDIQKGDTLCLIDLGYEGTTQNKIANILENEMNINVMGIYLIASHTPYWNENRFGMISPADYDARFISTLTNHIAAFEALCSSHDGSVSDYHADGKAMQEQKVGDSNWLTTIRSIQHYALKFIISFSKYDQAPAFNHKFLSDSVAIDLCRFLYLPFKDETNIFERKGFEINIGSNLEVNFVDINKSIEFMRRYGTARLLDGQAKDFRTNYSSELRYCGIEYSISLMASYRYGIKYPITKSIQRQHSLSVMFVNGHNVVTKDIISHYNFDGYYSLYIPLGDYEVAVMIGRCCSEMELFEIAVGHHSDLYTNFEAENMQVLELNNHYYVDGGVMNKKTITDINDNGMIYVPKKYSGDFILKITYRTIN
jgi:FMN phosphatase YigB (HAD superfamily)